MQAAGPDNIPGQLIRVCADQLAHVFADILNSSLNQAIIPPCFNSATIIPVSEKLAITYLNDFHPVALTSTIMKGFERVVKDHITSMLPKSFDPFQFAYQPNCSTEDAISSALHLSLEHPCTNVGVKSWTSAQHSTPSSPRTWYANWGPWASRPPV